MIHFLNRKSMNLESRPYAVDLTNALQECAAPLEAKHKGT